MQTGAKCARHTHDRHLAGRKQIDPAPQRSRHSAAGAKPTIGARPKRAAQGKHAWQGAEQHASAPASAIVCAWATPADTQARARARRRMCARLRLRLWAVVPTHERRATTTPARCIAGPQSRRRPGSRSCRPPARARWRRAPPAARPGAPEQRCASGAPGRRRRPCRAPAGRETPMVRCERM